MVISSENHPLVEVKHLSHRYSTDWAIRDINFELAENKIVGLLGSNGAGKSTLMNIICGVLTQTKGQVLINGWDINKNSTEAKKQIGFLPQKPPLHIDLSVQEYLEFAANIRLIPNKQVKKSVDEVLDKCGLKHFRHRLIKNLSGGYQQRVGIAQSIIHNPKFIVLDEPTNGLDPNQILEIRKLIQEISYGKIVLLSTHILQEVQAMCHDIIMIELGHFVFEGTVEEFNNSLTSKTLVIAFENEPNVEDLLSIEGISAIDAIDDKKFRIHLSTEESIQHRIVTEAFKNGWQIVEIYKEKINADEIFKHFSKGAERSVKI